MAISKKCACIPKTDKTFCSNCSRIKAVIMLKNGNNHLKLKDSTNGKLNCPVWYNRYSKNGKSDQYIAEKIRSKIAASYKYRGNYNLVVFYDNLANIKLPI